MAGALRRQRLSCPPSCHSRRRKLVLDERDLMALKRARGKRECGLGAVDDLVAASLSGLLEVPLSPGKKGGRGLAIPREGHDSRTEGQMPRRLIRATPKLHPPYSSPDTLGDGQGLRMARVEQQHAKTLGKATDDVGSPDELGDTARESGLHGFLELGVFGRHIWLENAEGEKVAVPGSPPSFS